jgi:hypothetical protein
MCAGWDDAEVLVVWVHQYVAAAEVNLVGAYFPVGLLEGLANLQLGESVTPSEDLPRILPHRVPQLYAGRVVQPVQDVAVAAYDPAIIEDADS